MEISNTSKFPTTIFFANGESSTVISKYAQEGITASAEQINATNLF